MWMSLISLFVGCIFTRYYYKRSLVKSLTPFVQFSSTPFRGIDPKVRNDLNIIYQGHSVKNLYEIQFLIANTGDKAIRDIIEPLTLSLPKECELLDATLLHIHPSGRKVELTYSPKNEYIEFNIQLLNSGDFFIVKFLLNGNPNISDFKFKISVDELPPILKIEQLPFDALVSKSDKKISFLSKITRHLVEFIFGIIILTIGLSVFLLIYREIKVMSVNNLSEILYHLYSVDIIFYAAIISFIPALMISIIGVMACLAALFDGSFPPRKNKFIVPEDKRLISLGWLPPHRSYLDIAKGERCTEVVSTSSDQKQRH